jgi:hypothetical protein
MSRHPIQQRYRVEDLVRLRRADEGARTAASQRQGRIDPNPHQVDAVIFALRRIPEGGCILADEVGLGKTIEAGLVIAQLRAEGARRILIIAPKPLIGQWQSELRALFAIEAVEARSAESLAGPGVFLVGREYAGSERGAALLGSADRFELCVIDEAHEIFAGIHKRYAASGEIRDDGKAAQTAYRVRTFLGTTPVVLLTATPIQNSLAELWGLVQYVEPTGSLLGDLRTFQDNFCDGDDRKVIPGQEHELRQRIATVMRRTLRRQAQEFLERPFVDRRCQLFEYEMSPEEHSLYDDVTGWLLDQKSCAFAGNQRRLLIIGFQRRMASSTAALIKSLERVAARLKLRLAGVATKEDDLTDFAMDLEDEDLILDDEAPETLTKLAPATPDEIKAELARVEGFIGRATRLPRDGKAASLVQAMGLLAERGQAGTGSGKAVIFTESLATQDYLAELLIRDAGLSPSEVTLFRGDNDSDAARGALARWEAEVGDKLPAYRQPSRDIAVRLALVHEFQTRSRVLIATEAGAKGLNLQFCDTVVNYDLPWNPQRIEQRIGRCHRYGQTRQVTVINFKARGNETEELTFEILGHKLDLFGKVLDASDRVLHEPGSHAPGTLVSSVALDMETKLRRIWERARTIDDVVRELKDLRDSVDKERHAFEERVQETASVIESRFDQGVRSVFRNLREMLPQAVASYDRALDEVLSGFLAARGVPFTRSEGKHMIRYAVAPSTALPAALAEGGTFGIGDAKALAGADPISLAHPLLQAAIEDARATRSTGVRLRVDSTAPGTLQARRGRRGKLLLVKARYDGLEPVEHLLPIAVLEGDQGPLAPEAAAALFSLAAEDVPGPLSPVLALPVSAIEDAVAEALFVDQAEVEQVEQARFETQVAQVERYAEDRARVLRRVHDKLAERIVAARTKRDAALGADSRERIERELGRLEKEQTEVGAKLARLETRDDDTYRRLKQDLHRRRYAAARVETLFDVEFSLS